MSDAGTSPAVGIAGHGGMPGMPSLPPPPKYQRADSEDASPTPPLQVGMAPDDVYAKVGAANDLIVVKKPDGGLTVSDFHILFPREKRVKGGPPNAPSSLPTTNKCVHTYINGNLQPKLFLRVKADGFCTFSDGRVQPAADALVALADDVSLVDGVNSIRFEIRYLRDPRVLVAECFAFVWGANTPMVVVDIDGTITRSDVSGLLMTLRPGLITDRTHAGICKTLARMVDEEGAQVVYLTSRPIVLAPKTRAFLTATEQDGEKLPLGPLHCCLEKVTGVLFRELVAKNMQDYKIDALLNLARPFREAERTFGESVFAAGIGNRLHDAVAYKAAGIPEDFIFLIDTNSNLRVWNGDTTKMGGNGDHSPISPSRRAGEEDRYEDQSLSTRPKTESRRQRLSNLLFSSSTSSSSSGSLGGAGSGGIGSSGSGRPGRGGGGGGGGRGGAHDFIVEAVEKLGFGNDDDDDDDDGEEEGIDFSPTFVQNPSGGSVGAASAVASASGGAPLATMMEESSSSVASSSTSGAAHSQPSSIGVGSAGRGNGKNGRPQLATAAAAGGEGGGVGGGGGGGGSSKLLHSFSSSSVASSAAADSVDYQSYADDRFFDRLRASLDLAAWEAQKAVAAAASAAQAGLQAGAQGVQHGVHGVHHGLQAGANGVQQGVQAGVQGVQAAGAEVQAGVRAVAASAGGALSGRGAGFGGSGHQGGGGGESGEAAESRLAERIQEMSAREQHPKPA